MTDAPDTPDNDQAPDAVEAPPEQGTEAKAKEPSEPKGKQEGKSPQAKGPAPWEKKLDEALNSDDPRSALDSIMRESQQYTTQKEQAAAAYDKLFGHYEDPVQMATVAGNIVGLLDEDPVSGITQILEALAGDGAADPEEVVNAIAEHFGLEYDEGDDDGEYDDDEDLDDFDDEDEESDDPRLSWVQQQMEEQETKQYEEQYANLVTELSDAVPGFDDDRFGKLVVLHEGDVEQAFTDYMDNWHKAPTPAPPQSPGGRPAPPTPPSYSNIDDAINAFMAEDLS